MNSELTLVPYKDKSILYNLIQFYRYDSSEYDGNALNEHGHYLYKYLDHQWTDDYRRPFIVKVEGEIAGFALVMLDVPKHFTKLARLPIRVRMSFGSGQFNRTKGTNM